jgi:glycosyltransferase involved in cell wall biosynthesis
VIAYPIGEMPDRCAPATDAKRVLYVGRLEERKGVRVLTGAWESVIREHPDATLRIVGADTRTAPGGGSMRERLLAGMSDRARRRTIFTGACRVDELARHYAWASVCVIPSLWENFPNTCIEAMAQARPVVVSDRGGMAEMIGETRAGETFRAGDEAELARVLGAMLREPAWTSIERGLIARQRILGLCDSKLAARDRIAFYRDAIRRRRAGDRHVPSCGAHGWWRSAERLMRGAPDAIATPQLLPAG